MKGPNKKQCVTTFTVWPFKKSDRRNTKNKN